MSSSYIVVGDELARIQGDLDLIEVGRQSVKPEPSLARTVGRGMMDRGVKDDTEIRIDRGLRSCGYDRPVSL